MKPIVLISLTVLLVSCNHLFYWPDQRQYLDLNRIDLDHRSNYLHTPDHQKIHYVELSPSLPEKATLVHFHGNAQNLTAHIAFVSWLAALGIRVYSFDYRGYGFSSGSPHRRGVIVDGKTILNHVCQNSRSPVIVLGQSLGGAIALPAIAEGPQGCVCSIVLDGVFHSYRQIARQKLSSNPLTWVLQYPLSWLISDLDSPDQYGDRISQALLMFHSKNDRVVPWQSGRRLFAKIGSADKTFELQKGFTHLQTLYPKSQYRRQTLDFIVRTAKNCRAGIDL